MKLYHTSFSIIENPDIYFGKKNADFGQGFYLSDDEALKVLQIGPVYRQIAIKSVQAKEKLIWRGYEIVDERAVAGYRELVEKEKEEFQIAFAKVLEEL